MPTSKSEEGSMDATVQDGPPTPEPQFKPGSAFWMSFTAIIVSLFLSAVDLTGVSVTLPTITQDLNGGEDFVWVGSAYSLASTAILPLTGSLANIFGRKPIMVISITIFALGSALSGAAQNMNMLIGARTVQGLGGGGILNLSNIIISDLVPLSQRGLYQGILLLSYCLASAIGPPIGGALAEKASWRWLFYINLPLTGIAFILVILFLKVRSPEGSIREKLGKVDWLGNVIIIAGSALVIIGLTWGGVRYAWDSAQVLAPLIIGFALIFAFVVYEATVPEIPTIPFKVLTNRTTIGGYIETLIHGIVSMAIIYYIPVYFQASYDSSPLRAGVQVLPTALIMAPFSFIGGVMIKVIRKYRPSNILGWLLTVIGFGLMSLLKADSTTGQWVGYQFISAAGTGLIFSATMFPVLAPLPVELTAPAIAFLYFLRTFSQTWGIAIAGTILQNELKKKLPTAFLAQFPSGSEIAYALIPTIHTLPEPLQTEVRVAFAESMSMIWKVMIGISGIGVLALFLLKEVEMKTHTDTKYGLNEKKSDVAVTEISEQA